MQESKRQQLPQPVFVRPEWLSQCVQENRIVDARPFEWAPASRNELAPVTAATAGVSSETYAFQTVSPSQTSASLFQPTLSKPIASRHIATTSDSQEEDTDPVSALSIQPVAEHGDRAELVRHRFIPPKDGPMSKRINAFAFAKSGTEEAQKPNFNSHLTEHFDKMVELTSNSNFPADQYELRALHVLTWLTSLMTGGVTPTTSECPPFCEGWTSK